MLKWIKKKLGILSMQARIENIEKDLVRIYKEQNWIEKKARIGKKPLRHDQHQRARKLEKKRNKTLAHS